jgi:hypothetical protein
MTRPNPHYWFPAKQYGWGWGPPRCWQGWAVLVAYLLAIALMVPFILARAGKNDAVVFAMGVTVLLLYVVYKKGEPPGWRSGD